MPTSETHFTPTTITGKPVRDEAQAFWQQLAQRTPTVYMTPLLIGSNLLIWLLMVGAGAGIMGENLMVFLEWGANYAPLTRSGEWWRLLTSAFLHFGLMHLAFNLFALVQIGPLVEQMYGNVGYLLLYLAAAIAGSLASLVFHPQPVLSAGASGAIFGLYGALLGYLLVRRHSVPRAVLTPLRNHTLWFVGYSLVMGLSSVGIDNAAHVGGFVGGFVLGMVYTGLFGPTDPRLVKVGWYDLIES